MQGEAAGGVEKGRHHKPGETKGSHRGHAWSGSSTSRTARSGFLLFLSRGLWRLVR